MTPRDHDIDTQIATVISSFDPAMLSAFVIAGLLLNITPGIDFLFVSMCGIAAGPRVGMAAACGISLGITLHVLMAAAGVSALLLTHPAAYDAIRYLGAAYLLWLAIQSWRATDVISSDHKALTARAAVWRGFITNLLNPKTTLFIFAFIPQFTDPAHGPVWLQILILGAIFQFNGFLVVLFVGATSGALAQKLNPRIRLLNRLTAIVFGGLAVRLLAG